MALMGPLYCETPALLTNFPAEPVNTWSNLFIIAIGLVALTLVLGRPGRVGRGSLVTLALLLTLTGLGSFLWHGWRTSAFLLLDALPGALFLFMATFMWLRRFYNSWSAFFIFCGFLALTALSLFTGASLLKNNLIFVSIAPLVVLLGAWLVARTYQESLRAAFMGGSALFFAVVALMFRSIDQAVCITFPIGTHFLWHILLSLAGLLIILMFIVIDYTRRLAGPPVPFAHYISLRPTSPYAKHRFLHGDQF